VVPSGRIIRAEFPLAVLIWWISSVPFDQEFKTSPAACARTIPGLVRTSTVIARIYMDSLVNALIFIAFLRIPTTPDINL
jgi:hypothetical protein